MMQAHFFRTLLFLTFTALFGACGDDDSNADGGADGSTDATVDTSQDGDLPDAPPVDAVVGDARVDASDDAAPSDAATDANPEDGGSVDAAPSDADVDTGELDSGMDAAADASADSSMDATPDDASIDSGGTLDSGMDAAPDAFDPTCGCPAGQYCDFSGFFCDGTTRCLDIPSRPCDGAGSPICGCDGRLYPNQCTARMSGVDVHADPSFCTDDPLEDCEYEPVAPDPPGACPDMLRGYFWTGAGCEPLFGCRCRGEGCDELFVTRELCLEIHADCT